MRIFWLTLMLAALPGRAHAFPEMIRFGYNNCTICHVSPAGGGLLTSYGRSLSAEVLSTWGNEEDAGVFWRAVDREKLEKYFLLGGDVRAAQIYQEDSAHKAARWVNMQANVAAGIQRERWGAAFTLGQLDDANAKLTAWSPYGSEFYAYYKPLEAVSVRGGRFTPAYGLHIPDHIAFMRSFLGFGLNGVRDSAEVQYTGTQYTFNFTHSKEFDTDDPEIANSVQAQVFFWDRFKVAANYWSGAGQHFSRTISGLWSVLGFTKKFYLVSEVDLQSKSVTGVNTRSFVSYNKLGYTIFKGFDAIFVSEHLHADLSDHSTITNRNGPGFQFYPVPHLEFTGVWSKQVATAAGALGEDYAWILLHYYF